MYLDFAPLEGITTALYRRLHHQYCGGVDRYYTPFLSPTQDHRLTPREQREILPEYNTGITVIPQLLTKNADDFLWAAHRLSEMGYGEVNLNLGCPSGTVTAKGKGAGMLADPDALDQFLDHIFSGCPCRISIKTRLGLESPDEFAAVLAIYNRYPLSELIVHPRVRRDLYRHPVRPEAFKQAYANSSNPISYNGSIVIPQDFHNCCETYSNLNAIMIGQGLVSDPFLGQKIRGGPSGSKKQLQDFAESLMDGYASQFGSEHNAFKRMKDVWFYLIRLFENSEKYGKRILKSNTPDQYRLAVSSVFADLRLLEQSTGGW